MCMARARFQRRLFSRPASAFHNLIQHPASAASRTRVRCTVNHASGGTPRSLFNIHTRRQVLDRLWSICLCGSPPESHGRDPCSLLHLHAAPRATRGSWVKPRYGATRPNPSSNTAWQLSICFHRRLALFFMFLDSKSKTPGCVTDQPHQNVAPGSMAKGNDELESISLVKLIATITIHHEPRLQLPLV